jgi:molybdopterin converting factor small subunit
MTAHVKILLSGMYRELAGQRELLEAVSSGTTLLEILVTLAKTYGKDFEEIVDSKTGQISLGAWIMVNGMSVRRTDIQLKSNDVVTISVPIGGG